MVIRRALRGRRVILRRGGGRALGRSQRLFKSTNFASTSRFRRFGLRGVRRRALVVDASRRFERAEPEKSAVGKDPATESLPRALARAARGAYYRLAPTADARRAGETLAVVVDA